jgi:hypothetical protein
MSFMNGGGYWFADLLNNLAGDFFVFYLRWLDGFDFGGHLVTSCLEYIRFLGVGQGEKCVIMIAEAEMSESRIRELVEFMYGREDAGKILPELFRILKEGRPAGRGLEKSPGITNRDALLICYGDMLSAPAEGAGDWEPGRSGGALSRLGRFLGSRNQGAFSYLHILPFHPYSSDDGFSVIDYRQVDPRLGTWEDIGRLAACCTCGFFAPNVAKNPDSRACFCSLQGKKSTFSRFLKVLCAKRSKLPAACQLPEQKLG